MLKIVLFSAVLISLVASQYKTIKDGDTLDGRIDYGYERYIWTLDNKCVDNSCDAAFFLTTFSDWV